MTEANTPKYKLRRRSKNYVGLWLGDHCLAAICVKTERGVLDAQFLLRVCNNHKNMLDALENIALGQMQLPSAKAFENHAVYIATGAIERAKKSDV